jgi:plasmid rolling circle replication initiator protein Rep
MGTNALQNLRVTISDPKPVYQYLSQWSDRDSVWDKQRHRTEQIEKLYRWAQREDFSRYADRVSACSQVLQFGYETSEDGVVSLRLKSSDFCRVRHCPVCQWRKSLRWQGRFLEALPRIEADYPKARWLFLTLTQRNCELEDLRGQLKEINKAFAKMVTWNNWPAIGWVKALEVTRNRETGQAHPHLHALLMVKGHYFTGRNYISQETWTQMWRKAMRLDYDPVVHVKAVKPRAGGQEGEHPLRAAVAEAMKYTVKPSDMIASGPWFWTLTDQLHGSRAIALGGVLPGYINEAEPTKDEMIQGDQGEQSEREQQTLFGVKWRVNPAQAKYGRKQ